MGVVTVNEEAVVTKEVDCVGENGPGGGVGERKTVVFGFFDHESGIEFYVVHCWVEFFEEFGDFGVGVHV